jgi:hypothetical protein
MAFAIFWMVIGDLITYHQEVMFGVKLFEEQDPFTKPKSQDDGKTASLKAHKGVDKPENFHSSLIYALIAEQDNKITRHFIAFTLFQLPPSAYISLHNSIIGLRAPPFCEA